MVGRRRKPKPSQVVPVSRCKFLRFSFRGPNLVWHEKAFHQFKHQIRLLTGRSWGVSMKNRILELNQYLSGWINYFGIAQGYQKCIDLDGWIRRRLRMCYWKRWRKARTKIKNLMKLGVIENLAVSCGASSKSYWHSAKTEGINKALSNEFF